MLIAAASAYAAINTYTAKDPVVSPDKAGTATKPVSVGYMRGPDGDGHAARTARRAQQHHDQDLRPEG